MKEHIYTVKHERGKFGGGGGSKADSLGVGDAKAKIVSGDIYG